MIFFRRRVMDREVADTLPPPTNPSTGGPGWDVDWARSVTSPLPSRVRVTDRAEGREEMEEDSGASSEEEVAVVNEGEDIEIRDYIEEELRQAARSRRERGSLEEGLAIDDAQADSSPVYFVRARDLGNHEPCPRYRDVVPPVYRERGYYKTQRNDD